MRQQELLGQGRGRAPWHRVCCPQPAAGRERSHLQTTERAPHLQTCPHLQILAPSGYLFHPCACWKGSSNAGVPHIRDVRRRTSQHIPPRRLQVQALCWTWLLQRSGWDLNVDKIWNRAPEMLQNIWPWRNSNLTGQGPEQFSLVNLSLKGGLDLKTSRGTFFQINLFLEMLSKGFWFFNKVEVSQDMPKGKKLPAVFC